MLTSIVSTITDWKTEGKEETLKTVFKLNFLKRHCPRQLLLFIEKQCLLESENVLDIPEKSFVENRINL